MYINDPSGHGLSEREITKRKKKVAELKEKQQELTSQMTGVAPPVSFTILTLQAFTKGINEDEEDPNARLLGEDGEYDDTRGKTSKQLLNKQREMLKNQDSALDEIHGIAHEMRKDGELIGTELRAQNEMLDELGNGIDRTQARMMRVDNRLKKLIASSSQRCLWCIIVLEIVALVLLIVLLN